MKVSYTPVKGWYCESSSKTGRAHGERIRDLGKKYLQDFLPTPRKVEKPGISARILGIVFALQSEIEQVCFSVIELIESIRGQHQGGRHRDADARKAPRDAVLCAREWRTKARPRALPPQRSSADPQETCLRGLKVSALKSPISNSLCSRR